jgi:hypothetical protein
MLEARERQVGMNVDEDRPAVRELEMGKMMGDLKSNPEFPELSGKEA